MLGIKNLKEILKSRALFKNLIKQRQLHRQRLHESFKGVMGHNPFPYRYSAGIYVTRFLAGLKQGQLLASRCKHCNTTLIPCRMVCGKCFKPMEEIVKINGTGRLISYTQVSFPFIDPFTGKNRPVPYCYGMIQLDGCDNSFQAVLNLRYHHQLKTGLPVKAVFKWKRRGHLDDIKHFKILAEKEA